jgi:hypothetical protein
MVKFGHSRQHHEGEPTQDSMDRSGISPVPLPFADGLRDTLVMSQPSFGEQSHRIKNENQSAPGREPTLMGCSNVRWRKSRLRQVELLLISCLSGTKI